MIIKKFWRWVSCIEFGLADKKITGGVKMGFQNPPRGFR
jgi:hypothetical protein